VFDVDPRDSDGGRDPEREDLYDSRLIRIRESARARAGGRRRSARFTSLRAVTWTTCATAPPTRATIRWSVWIRRADPVCRERCRTAYCRAHDRGSDVLKSNRRDRNESGQELPLGPSRAHVTAKAVISAHAAASMNGTRPFLRCCDSLFAIGRFNLGAPVGRPM
jgi:hypothetical protein